MKRLQAPCVKTNRQSFETDSANQSFYIQIFFACTSYGISSLSPKAKEKKEVCSGEAGEGRQVMLCSEGWGSGGGAPGKIFLGHTHYSLWERPFS